MSKHDSTWQDMSWQVKACDSIWHDMTCQSVWLNLTWHDMSKSGTQHDMTWHVKAWLNMTWHDMSKRVTQRDMTCHVKACDSTWCSEHSGVFVKRGQAAEWEGGGLDGEQDTGNGKKRGGVGRFDFQKFSQILAPGVSLSYFASKKA